MAGGKSVRSPFSATRKPPSPSAEESSSEEEVDTTAAAETSVRSREGGRKRSHAERGRTAKGSRHREKQRREGEKTHRRRRRTHRSRRRRSATPDKRRRSESSRRAVADPKKLQKQLAAPRSPQRAPSKTGTKKCPHCWAEVTVHPSGRAQHMWSNRRCLEWQFYNGLSSDLKKANDTLAWQRARDAAAVLYERRRTLSAPHPTEEAEVPPPPLPSLPSRAASRAATEEYEDVPVEDEPVPAVVQRPTRSGPAPAAASGVSGTKGTGHGPPAEPPAPSASTTEKSAAAQKQQIVINITSS